MKISDIKQQVKRKDRYSIYIDGKYSFSLSENGLLRQHLKIGQDISNDEFNNLQNEAEEDKSYSRSIDLLSRRQRSEWEMRQYLLRKTYNDEVINKTIKQLYNKGYLNDLSFAKSWLESRRLLKGSSSRKIRLELMQKHIDEEIISKVLSEDETSEVELLESIILKKRRQTRYQDNEKLVSYLSRQGFNYGDIKTALNAMQQQEKS
jgi:regulatory protein